VNVKGHLNCFSFQIHVQEMRSMERASAERMLFPTPLSKRAQFKLIQGQSL